MYSAKDSLSQRSSHHSIVTRSPNHMCAISCEIALARSSRSSAVGGVVKSIWSRNRIAPGCSSAPQLSSGTNAWP